MKPALGLRLLRREEKKRTAHYRRVIKVIEGRLRDCEPGSKIEKDTLANLALYKRLHAEAAAEVEALTRRIKS